MTRSRQAMLVGAGTFAYLMAYPLTIGRTDESHLLHGAWRVLDGQVLYRDFYEIITPLAFYFFAAVFRIGGTTLHAARTAMALIDALGAAVLFLLARRVAGLPEALLATLLLPALSVPVWPYASAHWISTTLALVVAAVLLRDRWRESSRARPLAVGTLTGIAICVQQQRGPFLLLWVILALTVLAAARPAATRWRTWRAEVVWVVAGVALVTVTVLGHAAWAASPGLLVEALYRFAVDSYGMHGRATGWAGVVPLGDPWLAYTWRWLLRWAPLLVVAEGILLAGTGPCPWPRTALVRACFCLLAACMAASVWYLPDIVHVSFVLPFLAIPGARVLSGVRRWPGWTRVPGARPLIAGLLLAALVAVAAKGVTNLRQARAAATVTLQTAFGPLQEDPFVAGFFQAVRRNLVREADGRSLLYSYPIDAWLYPTLPARDAFGWDILASGFPQRYFDEATGMLRRRVPGTVVVLSVFPPPPEMRAAIDTGYELVEEVYPYLIYRRRGATPPAPSAEPPPGGVDARS